MRTYHLGLAASVVLASLLLAPAMVSQNKSIKLFDDKTFNGWEGNLKFFRIEQSAIVGGSMKESLDHNEFLCTTKPYSDFVLRLKVKLMGDPARANAGIQLRSKRIPNHHEVIGYQADMGQTYWGALYDESRRRKILAGPTAEELNKHLKRDDWNEYEIRAEGKRIRLSVNGYQTADYTEAEEGIDQTGVICLQVHAGPPSEAWYKEIRIELLSNKK
jgi:3-keto-disaccharide hydrolase